MSFLIPFLCLSEFCSNLLRNDLCTSKNFLFISNVLDIYSLRICISSFGDLFQGRHLNFFLGGQNFFFNATGLLKNWKKQHFICSNLTLFIVPFCLFSLFSFFFFLLFPRGATAPQPPK